ncbi:hypothetical protein ACJVC5_14220 [Peredibacter sp. HCB2-198]|uniref:hypothetical protein n=1 Tax=Peredibacter sp. HCB2-198 TaxID=3383025 RepID=UPI0038B604A5
MQAFLKKHGPSHSAHSLKIEWEFAQNEVTIRFTAQKRTSRPWLADETKTMDWSKNWGLWNTDVVEAFLQLRSNPQDKTAPYLEIQVSPLNQPFALIITEPRKTFHPPKELEFIHESSVDGRMWTGVMKVKLPSELKGTHLYGGFFACLDHDPREYYALEPNPEQNPDFHRPELFLPLGEV